MQVEGVESLPAERPAAGRRQPRQPLGPDDGRDRGAQAAADPGAGEIDPLGRAGAGADPQRDGPGADRARQGRRGGAGESDRDPPRRRLHRRLPGRHALARQGAARPQRASAAWRSRSPRRTSAWSRSKAPPTSPASRAARACGSASSTPPAASRAPTRTRASSRPACSPRSAPWSRPRSPTASEPGAASPA